MAPWCHEPRRGHLAGRSVLLRILALQPLLAGVGRAARDRIGAAAGLRAAAIATGRSEAGAAARSSQQWSGWKAALQAYAATGTRPTGRDGPLRRRGVVADGQVAAPPPCPRPTTRLFAGLPGAPADSDPRPEAELTALDPKPQASEELFLSVPPEWADKFLPGSVQFLDRQFFQEGDKQWSTEFYRARLKRDPQEAVIFDVAQTQCPEARRDIYMGRRCGMLTSVLGQMRNVCPAFEAQIFEESTFVLRPAVDANLQYLLEDLRRQDRPADQGRALLPNFRALHLVRDIMTGVQSLEKAGVLHFDLTPDNIVVKDGRAYITNFGSMCLQHGGDAGVGCECFVDTPSHLLGTAFRSAPEMSGGRPTGPSNHVWAAGLILGEVVLGDMPVNLFFYGDRSEDGLIEDTHPRKNMSMNIMNLLDSEPFGRELLRGVVEDNFDVGMLAGFDDLPEYMRELLEGMLEKEVEDRWSTDQVLEAVELLLPRLGHDVLPFAPALTAPEAWFATEPS